jgi:hypothetical protein
MNKDWIVSSKIRSAASVLAAAILAGTLAGCESGDVVGEYPEPRGGGRYGYGSEEKTVFGEGGLSNLFGDDKKGAEQGGGGIRVNAFLWRASLDTISFMPVSSADAFGGVIITDWHSPDGIANERFKMNVYILGRSLRADGVRVAVFRQVQDTAGAWRDAKLPEQTATRIEDSILTKARQLRSKVLEQQ